MPGNILIVTAVQAEQDAIGHPNGTVIISGGIGKTNAAAATTAAILSDGPFLCVISAGIAGALPDSGLAIGDTVVASACVYAEEGLVTPTGFQDMKKMGFSLGNFEGNKVPVEAWMLERLSCLGTIAPIATVSTCSGTDAQANLIQTRTGCVCESMEGAAIVHAANRMNTDGIEIRTISNTTGNRASQVWNIELALMNLGKSVREALICLWG